MLRTITAAAALPVSLDEARLHLRRDDLDDDTIIQTLLAAATVHAQNLVQRRFVTQVVEFVTDRWCGGRIDLPIAPVDAKTGIVSIKYFDLSDAEQLLDPSLYVAQARGPSVRIIPRFGTVWPLVNPFAAEPIVIRFTVGDAPADVEPNVKAAILLILGHLYENRANVVMGAQGLQAIELPQGAEPLLMAEVW